MSSENTAAVTEATDETSGTWTANAGDELPDFEVIPVDGCLSSLNSF